MAEKSRGPSKQPSVKAFHAKDYPREYVMASALAAFLNYPLWRASAVGQSGFHVAANHTSLQTFTSWRTATSSKRVIPTFVRPYLYAFQPPYKGLLATVAGMTWARAAIFWGSDVGRDLLRSAGHSDSVSTVVPPLIVSTLVQCINMPVVRASITLQNPTSELPNVSSSVRHIYQTRGLTGLWHGTSAGILKTVPKYCTAVVVKDLMEEWLPPPETNSDRLWRSAYKSVAAGVAGAALTNPLDVIRNEMFKTNLGLVATIRHLHSDLGYSFVTRGLGKNLIAVSIPVASTIFFTDALIQLRKSQDSVAH